MDEKTQETQEKASENKPASDTKEGIQPEADSLIKQTNEAAERAEKAVDLFRKENDRREQMDIAAKLAGKGQAGQTIVKPVDKEKEAANARIKAVGDATGALWAKNMEKKDGE